MLALPGGDVMAGGRFAEIDGQTVYGVAQWNSVAWTQVGNGLWGDVNALAQLPNGGGIVAGGDFPATINNPRRVARWDGTAWQPMGNGMTLAVHALLVTSWGHLIAGGAFTVWAQRVAGWDGNAWYPLSLPSPSTVYSIAELPDGDLVVGGSGYVRRSTATSWDMLLDSPLGTVTGLAMAGSGELVAVGSFREGGDAGTPWIAEWTSNCPPGVVDLGGGCASSGGDNRLTADNIPVLDSAWRTRATELPASAFVATVYGFAGASLPLDAVFVEALPGCDLLATPDVLDIVLSASGQIERSVPIPASTSVLGATLHHQLVAFELDPTFVVVEITSTNALLGTVGLF